MFDAHLLALAGRGEFGHQKATLLIAD